MTKRREEVTEAALALPPEARAELAERLLDSLEPAERAEIDVACAAEIERRIDELDRGDVQLLPGDAVIANARNALMGNARAEGLQ